MKTEKEDLTPGTQELVSRFLVQYELLQPAEVTGEKHKEITIPGRYRYDAARAAYYALARRGIRPNLRWSMSGVTFVVNSGIPHTVGIYVPPKEADILRYQYQALALSGGMVIFMVLVMLAVVIAPATAPLALISGAGVWLASIFLLAPLAADTVAAMRFKR